MDLRQFAFLIRQPSATLQPREHFWGLPKRGLALILANALFWQPLLAQADGIVVSGPGTSLGTAGNGVPIVNIAAPNGSGLSHNQFKDYNVGPNGVILNNGVNPTQSTQLGGIILGNPNLRGNAAQVILNEVNGGSPSQLRGYTEVAGQSATVIVANPYGISCNGCGFINTPKVTLTTGKPILDNGNLDRYQVDGGAVSIDGKGLNASGVDHFEIITRSAKINAQINARELTVIAGRNDVNAKTLATTARADDGSAKPELAIDSSALGGMYAGAIRLVGTEAGVGVKLDGTLASSGGDIQLDANGQLTMAQASATGDLKINAQNVDLKDKTYATGKVEITTPGELINRQSIAARERVEINAATLTNPGIVEAGVERDNTRNASGDLVINSKTVNSSGNLLASRTQTLTATQTLNNQGGVIQARSLNITSVKLLNQGAKARLFGEQALVLNAPAIVNLGGVIRFGADQAAVLKTDTLDNRQGHIEVAGGSLKLQARELNNDAGKIIAGSLDASADKVSNQSGLLAASLGDARVTSIGTLDNRAGKIQAGKQLTAQADELLNQGGTLVADHVSVNASTLNNSAKGLVSAENGGVSLTTDQAFDNTQGRVQATTGLTVTAASITNQNGTLLGKDLTLTSRGAFDNRQGHVDGERLRLNSQNLDNNAGLLQGRELLSVTASDLANQGGSLIGGTLDATLDSLGNNDKGVLSAETGALTVTVRDHLNNALGHLQAVAGDVQIRAASLGNQQGAIVGKQLLVVAKSGQIDNSGGRIVGDGLNVQASSLDNRNGGQLVAGAGGIDLVLTDSLLNSQGRLQSAGRLHVEAVTVNNSAGVLLGQRLDISAEELDNSNKGGLVSNDGDIELSVSRLLTNTHGVIDAGERSLLVKALTTLNNQSGTLRGKRLEIHASALNNDKGQLLAGSEGLDYRGQSLSNRQGMILAGGGKTDLALDQGTLSNQGGTVQGDSVTVTAGSVDNSNDGTRAGTITGLLGNLQLTAQTLTNQGGRLFAKELITVTSDTLDNRSGGQISARQLDLTARANLFNQGGLIESSDYLNVTGANFDNSAGGQLRALGGATSTVSLSGTLSNQKGILEIGSQAFALSAGQLNNQGGRLQHAGTGLFSIDLGGYSGAQGSITGLGSGKWALGRVDGLGSLQLNDTLTYTSAQALVVNAGERLASAKGLILNVASLNNAGELLSDGDLSITLAGDMTNSGRVSAQQKLTLSANNLNQAGGRLASGGDSVITLSGALDNLGYLTARQNLRIGAGQIDNRGTLGAQGNVSLTAASGITNAADTLLFSGGDLALRARSFSNSYGDVYSRGSLSFAAADGGRAQSFSNLSGTVESEGAIDINAGRIENAKAEFEMGETLTSGNIYWVCGQHCRESDSWRRGTITIYQTFTQAAVKDSASARLVAGKNMTLQGDNVQNRYSLMAANGNLTITAQDLLNQGASTRTGQNKIVINTPGHVDRYLWENRMEDVDLPAFNAAVAAGNFDKARFEELKARSPTTNPYVPGQIFSETSNVTVWSDDPNTRYAATMQAGGAVDLQVAHKIQNGTLYENTLAQLTGTLADDQTGIPVGGININLNKQATGATNQAPAAVQRIESVAADGSLQVNFVPVDYTGVPFAPVDPTAAPSFQLPKGDYGLFIKNNDPTSQYLIETNPNLTNLSKFFSSDYMLDQVGYKPDDNWRRLGDGLYETRLIRDAVLAQTGQRFLAGGLTSDYDQFRYLMDNAIASKDALRLSVGVSLTPQQVSALTHDIVWMETRVVDGQTVLAPVLYLAQAEARNVRGSSLIQGRDLNLLTGGDLVNVGTLRASDNLNVVSGGSVYQGGLVEAGKNVSLLAQDSIRNAMAGEIRGNQVNLTALKGDVINDRTAIQVRDGVGMRTLTDAGSSITAKENLAIAAGRDLTNYGAVSAGGDATLSAVRDLNVMAVSDIRETHESREGGEKTSITTEVRNLAATVTAGGNVALEAGRDVMIGASEVTAGKNLDITAGRDVTVISGSDTYNVEGKEKDGKKRIKTSDNQTTQVASVLTAGNDFTSQAGRDTTLLASKISAGNEAYLYSGDRLNLLAEQESSYTLYDMKEKSGWGSKKTRRDEVTRVTHVGTEITSGGDLTLVSGGDQLYQRAKLNSAKDIAIVSGGAVTFEAVKDLHQESHEKSKSDLAWTSAKGKGNTDETLRQTEIVAQGKFAIQAADGLKIDIKQLDQKTVAQTIDVMVKADPQLAWLKEAEKRGDVDWRQVQEMHDSFKYSHSSLGQGAMLAIIIVVTALTAGAASGALGAAAGAGAGSGSAMAAGGSAAMVQAGTAVGTAAAGWGNVMVTSALSSMAGTAAASTINNKGNLGKVLKDVSSKDALKGYATGAVIAGFGAAYTDSWGRELTTDGNYKVVNIGERLKAYTANTALKGVLSGKDKKTWMSIAATGALMEIYQYTAGRAPDVRPGVDREGGAKFTALEGGFVPKEVVGTGEREGINIGLNRIKGCESIFSVCHGTPISQALNKVPGFNAFATLHDGWMGNLEVAKGADMNLFENLGSMPPALLVNYGALYDKYRPSIEAEKKRREKN